MSEKEKKEGKEVEKEQKEELAQKEGASGAAQSIKQLTPKQIFDAYPNDRDKANNYLLLSIQTDLNRIANVLEYFANKDMADASSKKISTGPR